MESPSESGAESQGAADSDNESDHSGFVTLGRDLDEEGELNLDESTFADLDATAAAYAETASENNSKEATEKTRRLAVVNLNWDHVQLLPFRYLPMQSKDEKSLKNTKSAKATVARGNVLSVRVYPSEFGKERIAREEEGPPAEMKIENEEDVSEWTIHETGDGAHYDEDALRKYQFKLERLRYHYAIVECDTAEAAAHIYNKLEGIELEQSANVFDLKYHDEAIDDPGTRYRAVEFVTEALRHSKVKLTWDDDDPERNHIARRSLTKKEIEEADFKAYIASSFSESDNDQDPVSKKRSKKSAQRDKLCTLLLAGDDDEFTKGWGGDDDAGKHDDVDIEIMFTPGLTEATNIEDETTMEDYQFAIDPSNPHLKKMKSMVALIDERTKRQRRSHPEDETSAWLPTKGDDTNPKNLVESVKRKSAAAQTFGIGADGKPNSGFAPVNSFSPNSSFYGKVSPAT
ncbi:hypothetical protein BDR04DRAFT_1118794 [Suillus decipiens]|nr:hypothetical protein BDR04DRAFT_1118794 [Suillus decipiens]